MLVLFYASRSDLPALTDLILYSYAIMGLYDKTTMFPGEKPNTLTNTLSMINLPSLRRIRGRGIRQFKNMNVVTLKSK